jgi:hypothetical protein
MYLYMLGLIMVSGSIIIIIMGSRQQRSSRTSVKVTSGQHMASTRS